MVIALRDGMMERLEGVDRELPPGVKMKHRLKIITGILLLVAVAVIALGVFRNLITPSVKRSRILTAVAEIGSIEDVLNASGVVAPEFEQLITSPITSKVDSVYHKAGDSVVKGESIVKLNDEFILIEYGKLSDQHELRINRKQQREIEMERELIDLEAQYDVMELRAQFSQSKYDMEKQLMDMGAGTKEALQLAELDLSIARRELEQLQQQISNKRKSLVAELREHELQIQLSERKLNELGRQIELALTRAESDGVVTWVKDEIGAAVVPGEVIARIADLSSFKVRGTISEIHADKLKIEAPVKVRVGDEDLTGSVSNISPTIRDGIVRFYIELDEKTHGSLRSNLRVDVFVIRASKDNVVRVENGPFCSGSGRQEVFVIQGERAIRKTVTIGATNFDYVELTEGIEPGDEVIISDMEKYVHHQTVAVKRDE
jgi:HlyD family secretion protein